MAVSIVTRGLHGSGGGSTTGLVTSGLFAGSWGVPVVTPKPLGGFLVTLAPSPTYTLTSSPQYQLPSNERIKLL